MCRTLIARADQIPDGGATPEVWPVRARALGSGGVGAVCAVGALVGRWLDVPMGVLDYVAAQVGVADPSCVKRYAERDKTRLEHQWEIGRVYGFASFASAEAALAGGLGGEGGAAGGGPRVRPAPGGDRAGPLRDRAARPATPGTPGFSGRRWRCCSRPPSGART